MSGASTSGKWTSTGSGTFSPNDSTLNAIYLPSAADSVAQSVSLILTASNIGNCNAVRDTVNIDIFPTGTVNAGADQVLCANNANVSLNGVIGGGASKGRWISSGTGVFAPSNTALNATYIPSRNDSIIGGVQLKLVVTNSCNPAADSLNISFSAPPKVNAGPASAAICGTKPSLTLSGNVNGATGGQWTTSGDGTFSPNSTDMNATYNASNADISKGSVTLYLTSTGNGKCNPVVDSIFVNIGKGIVVDAGADQNVCSTAGYTQLSGTVSNGTSTGKWKTLGSGVFVPSDSLLTAEYQFSNADTLNGSVKLVLTSTNNGSCAAASDTIELIFGDAAYVNAGADQMSCAEDPDIILDGFVTGGATKAVWSSSGTGTFAPSDSALNAKYIPGNSDIVQGKVSLFLKTIDHGTCLQGKDTMQLMIEKKAIVDAGVDIEICAFNDSISLGGNISNAIGGRWTSNGTGTFLPTDTALNAYYQPSPSDLTKGEVQIYLSSRGSLVCNSVQDSMKISLVTPLEVDFDYEDACVGQLMSFYDSTVVRHGTITSWEWDFNDGKISNSKNPIHVFNSTGPRDVKLTVTSSLGCSSSIIKTVVVRDQPKAAFDVRPDSIYVDSSVSFLDASSRASGWTWDFGDGLGNSTMQSPKYVYQEKGTYKVRLIVNSIHGCTDTLIKSLTVFKNKKVEDKDTEEYDEEAPPLMPTAFSPNGDQENDRLRVLGGPFRSVELSVYNNWGNLVYKSKGDNKGWDGQWKGEPQAVGDYVYTVRVITLEGKEIRKHGSVSLIR